MRIHPCVLALAFAGRALPRAAQPPQQPPGAPVTRATTPGAAGATRETEPPQAEGVEPVEQVSTTQHPTNIGGKTIPYTANAGTMIIRDDAGKPEATVFYVAYTAHKMEASTRPVTFFFNGGPGSASSWLDMGIMSPKHPNMGPPGRCRHRPTTSSTTPTRRST